ncbi:MAG: hypothetical protein V3U54_13235 [Thermodesulfobacteriota bacterium]
MTTIENITFESLPTKKEAFVFLGCGGELKEWLTGIPNAMKEENIISDANPELWKVQKLTTTGGRTDLVFFPLLKVDLGKAAIWRIKFGYCTWLSDYLVNYAKHHLVKTEIENNDKM